MSELIISRLAHACSRGWRQTSLVNELLAGPVELWPKRIGGQEYWYVGASGVGYTSWMGLRKRLVEAGFAVRNEWESRTVEVVYPGVNI